jgi:phosphatidylglycerophosphate synthase
VGGYRARDLVNAPTLVSLLRLPLAAAFPFVRHDVGASLVVLLLAAGTDVVDGWIARRFGLATPTGAVVDGVTDKAFAATVLATLVITGIMPATDILLLGAREIGELPLVVWLALSPAARRRKVDDRANVFGKAAAVLQFSAIVATIVGSEWRTALVWITAAVGAAAALSYWRRTLAAVRQSNTPRRA